MLEKRKDDSEAVGKYQSMLVSVVIGGLIVWIAPMLIPVLTGQDFGTSLVAPPDILLEENETADNLNPNSFGGRISQLWDLGLWVVRLVLVFAVLIFVAMLRIGGEGGGGGGTAVPSATLDRRAGRRDATASAVLPLAGGRGRGGLWRQPCRTAGRRRDGAAPASAPPPS